MAKPEKKTNRKLRTQTRATPKKLTPLELGKKQQSESPQKTKKIPPQAPVWGWDFGANLGLVFLVLTLATSYSLYQINSFKMAILLVGLILAVVVGFIKQDLTQTKIKVIWLLFPALLLLSRLAALVFTGIHHNYNFSYELATGLMLFAWFYLNLTQTQTSQARQNLLGLMMLSLILGSAWAIGDWAFSGGESYPKAGFGHRNYMSGYLLLLLPLALSLAKPWEKDPTSLIKTISLWGGGLGVMALLLAQTRAAIIALVFTLLLFFIGRYWAIGDRAKFNQWVKILVGLGGLILLSILGLWVFNDLLPKTRFLDLLSAKAWSGRVLAWDAAWSSFVVSPYLGHGLGSSYNQFFAFISPDSLLLHGERSYNHAHSEPLEFLQEGGLLGITTYFLFWGFVFSRVWSGIQPHSKDPILALGVGLGLLGFFLHGFVSVAPRMIIVALPFFTLVALAFLLSEDQKTKRFNQPIHLSLVILPILASLIAFGPWGFSQYQFMNARGKLYHQNPSTSLKGFYELEALGYHTKDIYALKLLLKEQIRRDQPKEAEATAVRIQTIIPNYQDVAFDQAIISILQKEMDLGYNKAILSQQKNRYHLPSIRLISSLAIEFSDYPQFETQITRLVKKLAFNARLPKRWATDGAEVFVLQSIDDLNFFYEEGILEIELPKALLQNLFQKAKLHRELPRTLAKRKGMEFARELSSLFGRHPFFRPEFRGDYLGEKESIILDIKSFFQSEAEIIRLTKKRRSSYDDKLEAIIRAKSAKRDLLKEQLKKKIYFNSFQARQALATSMIRELSEILFPAPY